MTKQSLPRNRLAKRSRHIDRRSVVQVMQSNECDTAQSLPPGDLTDSLSSIDHKMRELGCIVLTNLCMDNSITSQKIIENEVIMKLVSNLMSDHVMNVRVLALGVLRAITSWAPSKVIFHLENNCKLYSNTLKCLQESFDSLLISTKMAGTHEALSTHSNIATQALTVMYHGCVASDAFVQRLSSSSPSNWAPLTVAPVLLAAKMSTFIEFNLLQVAGAASSFLAVLVEENTAAASMLISNDAVSALKSSYKFALNQLNSGLTLSKGQRSIFNCFNIELASALFSILGASAVDNDFVQSLLCVLANDVVLSGSQILMNLSSTTNAESKSNQHANIDECVGLDEEENANASFVDDTQTNNIDDDGNAMRLMGGERFEKDDDSVKAARKQQDELDLWVKDLNTSRVAAELLLTVHEEAVAAAACRKGLKKESAAAESARNILKSTDMAEMLFRGLKSVSSHLVIIIDTLRTRALLDEAQSLIGFATSLCHAAAVVASTSEIVRKSISTPEVICPVLNMVSGSVQILTSIQSDKIPLSSKSIFVTSAVDLTEASTRLSAEFLSILIEEPNSNLDPLINAQLQTALSTSVEILRTVNFDPDVVSAADASGLKDRLQDGWKSTRAMAASLTSQLAAVAPANILPLLAPVWCSVLKEEVAKGGLAASALLISELCDGFFERFGGEEFDTLLKECQLVTVLNETAACGREMLLKARMQRGFEIEGLERIKEETMPNLIEYIRYKKQNGC